MRSKIIGVTGLSGSGKTTVTRILESRGAFAAIADELAHEAILSGNPPYHAVLETFGRGILNEETGEIDRAKLGAVVFAKPNGDAPADGAVPETQRGSYVERQVSDGLKVLESIIHPYVFAKTWRLFDEAEKTGKYSFMVIDAPMLIEAGKHEKCDEVWLVTAPDELKIDRITLRDGITREAAAARLAVRNEEALKKYADIVIVNDGSVEDLKAQIQPRMI